MHTLSRLIPATLVAFTLNAACGTPATPGGDDDVTMDVDAGDTTSDATCAKVQELMDGPRRCDDDPNNAHYTVRIEMVSGSFATAACRFHGVDTVSSAEHFAFDLPYTLRGELTIANGALTRTSEGVTYLSCVK